MSDIAIHDLNAADEAVDQARSDLRQAGVNVQTARAALATALTAWHRGPGNDCPPECQGIPGAEPSGTTGPRRGGNIPPSSDCGGDRQSLRGRRHERPTRRRQSLRPRRAQQSSGVRSERPAHRSRSRRSQAPATTRMTVMATPRLPPAIRALRASLRGASKSGLRERLER